MPAIRPDEEQATVYVWEDGWEIVRPLTPDRMARYTSKIWAKSHTMPGKGGPHWPGAKRTSWLWPMDTTATKRIRRIVETRTPNFGFDPILFVLLNPQANPSAALAFRHYVGDRVPRLEAMWSVDGPRVVDKAVQGRLVDFVHYFVYADVFDDIASIADRASPDAHWSLGLPDPLITALAFKDLVMGPDRKHFERTRSTWTEQDPMRQEEALSEAVLPLLFRVGDILATFGSRMQLIGHEDPRHIRGFTRLSYPPWTEPLNLIIDFDGRTTEWTWRLGWEDLERREITWVAQNQDIAELFVDAGLMASPERYWQLIETTAIEGHPAFDPDVLESYALLNVLCPLFAPPLEFMTWWENLP